MQKTDAAELRRLWAKAEAVGGDGRDLAIAMNTAYLALPALLDEIEAAREEVRRLTQANGDIRKERDRAVAEAQRQDGVAKGLRRDFEAAREINGRLYEAAEIAANYLHGIRKAVPETIYADILGDWDVSHPAEDQCAYSRSGTESALSEALDKASDASEWLDARDNRMKLIGAAEELEKAAAEEWEVASYGGNPILIVGRLQQRAAKLRQEAEGK